MVGETSAMRVRRSHTRTLPPNFLGAPSSDSPKTSGVARLRGLWGSMSLEGWKPCTQGLNFRRTNTTLVTY